jgi:hypothetical protein
MTSTVGSNALQPSKEGKPTEGTLHLGDKLREGLQQEFPQPEAVRGRGISDPVGEELE